MTKEAEQTTALLPERERAEAMAQLVELSRPMAERMARRYRPADWEDLAAQAIIDLWQASSRFTPVKGTWAAYSRRCLKTSMMRQLSKARAKAKAHPEVALDPEWADEIPAPEDPEDAEAQSILGELLLHSKLEAALASLPEREAFVIRMRWLSEDGPHALQEVADALGLKTRAGALWIQRQGLRKLRIALREAEAQATRANRRQASPYRPIALRCRRRLNDAQVWLLRQHQSQDATMLAVTLQCHPEQVRQALRKVEGIITDEILAEGQERLREILSETRAVLTTVKNDCWRSGGGNWREGRVTSAFGVTCEELLLQRITDALLAL